MASLLPKFEYDIFISYRHNDNLDGWVTDFVQNLEKELRSTLKDTVTIYFDKNPHDGLLETHNVDKSLEGKLKCLIFIPIISQTYCDPKSFAWRHEFCAFNKLAKEDQFGRDIKLGNGNVASRILPVKIHELDAEDKTLLENELGGVLRAIEFIFKSPGVNRPLTSNDKREENSNKTFYRDQVNKVANAIKDVLNGITSKDFSDEVSAISVDQKSSAKLNKKKVRETPTVSFLYALKNFATVNKKSLVVITFILFISAMNFGSYWFGLKNAPTLTKPLIKYEIPLPGPLGQTLRHSMIISRDGESLVYAMNRVLYLKSLKDDDPPTPIPGTTNARDPFFSPDGKWISFENPFDKHIMKVPLRGGNPVKICDLDVALGITWYENVIYYGSGGAIYQVPDSGGSPGRIYPLNKTDHDPHIANPHLLPDHKTLLFSQRHDDGSWDIRIWPLGSKENPTVLVDKGRDGRFLNSGHIAYSLNNVLYMNEFDSKTNRMIGKPKIITTKPIFEPLASRFVDVGVSQFDLSENGILVYYESPASTGDLVWIENSGKIIPITRNAKRYSNSTISSDAQNIAATVRSLDGSPSNIEIINSKSGNSTLFAENADNPRWSKGNASIIYVSGNRIFEKPVNLTSQPKLLFILDSALSLFLGKLSADGKYLPINGFIAARAEEIGYYDMMDGKVQMLDHYNSKNVERSPAISPDGRWIAYNFDDGAILVAPFPGPGQPSKVSLDIENARGRFPFWSSDMTALYYTTSTNEIWKVNLQTKAKFSWETAKSVFNGGTSIVPIPSIHPNGNRFLGYKTKEQVYDINIVVNWDPELVSK